MVYSLIMFLAYVFMHVIYIHDFLLSFGTISNAQKNYHYNTKTSLLSHLRVNCWYERPRVNHSESLFQSLELEEHRV